VSDLPPPQRTLGQGGETRGLRSQLEFDRSMDSGTIGANACMGDCRSSRWSASDASAVSFVELTLQLVDLIRAALRFLGRSQGSRRGGPLPLRSCSRLASAVPRPRHGRHLCLCRIHSLVHPVALTLPLPPCLYRHHYLCPSLLLPPCLCRAPAPRHGRHLPLPHPLTGPPGRPAALTQALTLPLPPSFRRSAGPRRYRGLPTARRRALPRGRPSKQTSRSVARSFHGKGPSAEQAIVRRCARVWRWVPGPERRACRR
jgi:hypothetical protein